MPHWSQFTRFLWNPPCKSRTAPIPTSLHLPKTKTEPSSALLQMLPWSTPKTQSCPWAPTWRPAAGSTPTWGSTPALSSGRSMASSCPAPCTECWARPTSVSRWLDSTPPGRRLATTWSATTTRDTSWQAPASTLAVSTTFSLLILGSCCSLRGDAVQSYQG